MENTIALSKAISYMLWPICLLLIVFIFKKEIRILLLSFVKKQSEKIIGKKPPGTQIPAPTKLDDMLWRPTTNEEDLNDIAKRGNFGEKKNDDPMRMFELPASSVTRNETMKERKKISTPSRAKYIRQPFARQKMTPYISRNQFHIEFQDGGSRSWTLPDPKDKAGIREILYKAIAFAKEHRASRGQINAVRKKLTDEGYHLTK